jgi:hypothetical protein
MSMSQDELSLKAIADRYLLVLYRMSRGTPGIDINKNDWLAECARLKIAEMSDAEFERFRAESVAQFRQNNPN